MKILVTHKLMQVLDFSILPENKDNNDNSAKKSNDDNMLIINVSAFQ